MTLRGSIQGLMTGLNVLSYRSSTDRREMTDVLTFTLSDADESGEGGEHTLTRAIPLVLTLPPMPLTLQMPLVTSEESFALSFTTWTMAENAVRVWLGVEWVLLTGVEDHP